MSVPGPFVKPVSGFVRGGTLSSPTTVTMAYVWGGTDVRWGWRDVETPTAPDEDPYPTLGVPAGPRPTTEEPPSGLSSSKSQS